MVGRKTVNEELKYYFSPFELQDIGAALAQANQSIVELGERKKEAVSSIQADIEEAKTKIARLAKEISQGYIIKPILCDIIYNSPTEGMKQTIRRDTQEVVNTDEMTFNEVESEKQLELGLTGPGTDATPVLANGQTEAEFMAEGAALVADMPLADQIATMDNQLDAGSELAEPTEVKVEGMEDDLDSVELDGQ